MITLSKEVCSAEANIQDVELADLPRKGFGTVQQAFCGPADNIDQTANLYLRDDETAGCTSTDCSSCRFKPQKT